MHTKLIILARTAIILGSLLATASTRGDVPPSFSSLEKMGIDVQENKFDGGQGTFSVFINPLRVDAKLAGSALAQFAKSHKIVNFYTSQWSELKPDFFKSVGPLEDVTLLVLFSIAEGNDIAQIAGTFPNAESIELLEIGAMGRNTPVFLKAKQIKATGAMFDGDGLLKIAQMPEARGVFEVAANITEDELAKFAAALSPESKGRKILPFLLIDEEKSRRALESKAKDLGLHVYTPKEEVFHNQGSEKN